HQTRAESWGAGRTVTPIPRVPDGGTHDPGLGAFGSMCRLKVEDKITRRPQAVQLLKKLKAWTVLKKVYASQRTRAGKGKMRNQCRSQRRGPCSVSQEDNAYHQGQKIPWYYSANCKKLNSLKLAPGGHTMSTDFPGTRLMSTDLGPEMQRALRAPHKKIHRRVRKKNPPKDAKTACTDAILRQSRTHKLHVKKQEATAAAAAATAALAAESEKRAGPAERGLQKLRKKSQESKEARREKVTTVKKPAAEEKSTTGEKETASAIPPISSIHSARISRVRQNQGIQYEIAQQTVPQKQPQHPLLTSELRGFGPLTVTCSARYFPAGGGRGPIHAFSKDAH
ncbi:hypothetical protein U0070_015881, partial [Myodes glareolus]